MTVRDKKIDDSQSYLNSNMLNSAFSSRYIWVDKEL